MVMANQIDVTEEILPVRMKKFGCTLSATDNGYTIKYVLTNTKQNYRGFIYLKSSYEASGHATLHDLYSNFYYETGLKKVELRHGR
jgi:hypothetical protein